MRLTVKEIMYLRDIIIDELNTINDKKLPLKQIKIEAEWRVEKIMEDLVVKLVAAKKMAEGYEKEADKVLDSINERLKDLDANTISLYHYTAKTLKEQLKFHDLEQIEHKKIVKEHNLIKVPAAYEIEKMIIKSSMKNHQDLINSLVTKLAK